MVGLVLALLVAGCTDPEANAVTRWLVETDHQTGSAPQPLSGSGPAPGVLREDWRIEDIGPFSEQPGAGPEFSLIDGSLVVATRDGAVAYDAGTGARVWHYREPGRTAALGMTAGTVVILSRGAQDLDAPERLVGLDAGTGELLWQQQGTQLAAGQRGHLLTTADGVVPVVNAESRESAEVTGIDVRTGEAAWVTGYDRCGSGSAFGPSSLVIPRGSDGTLVLTESWCRHDEVVHAFRPTDGEPLWSRSWPNSGPGRYISVHESTAIVQAGPRLEVIGPDGESNTRDVDPLNDPMGFYLPVRHDDSSSLMDVRTGETVSEGWPRSLNARAPALDQDGTLYALGSAHPVPTLVMGTVDSGDITRMPLPGAEHVLGSARWAAPAGGRLLVARRDPDDPARALVTAYVAEATDGPVEFGGVPYEDWPDPCSLPVEGAHETEPTEGEPMVVGGVEHATQACWFSLSERGNGGRDRVRVQIVWVAPTPEFAEDWLAGEPGPPGVDEVVDGDYYLRARIGRVIVELRGRPHDVDLSAALAPLGESLSDY